MVGIAKAVSRSDLEPRGAKVLDVFLAQLSDFPCFKSLSLDSSASKQLTLAKVIGRWRSRRIRKYCSTCFQAGFGLGRRRFARRVPKFAKGILLSLPQASHIPWTKSSLKLSPNPNPTLAQRYGPLENPTQFAERPIPFKYCTKFAKGVCPARARPIFAPRGFIRAVHHAWQGCGQGRSRDCDLTAGGGSGRLGTRAADGPREDRICCG